MRRRVTCGRMAGHIVGENGRISMEGLRAPRRVCFRTSLRACLPLFVTAGILCGGAVPASATVPTGALSQLSSPANCIGEEAEGVADCGTKIPSGLSLAYQVKVSPEGTNAYSVAIDGALIEYKRDPATGALSEIGCITASSSPCAKSNSTDKVAIMEAPTAIAISPNGQNVYVTVQGHDAVVELEREPLTGLLTIMGAGKACVTGEAESECESEAAKGFSTPYGVVVSPDEKDVYVASAQGEAIAELERSTTTGLLTPISGHECIGAPESGCPVETAIGLHEPIGLALSPDGKNLYVAAGSAEERGDVAAFKRESDGSLKQLSGEEGCVSQEISGCRSATAMKGSEDLVVSGDGRNVYATSFPNSAVVELERDGTTGALTQLGGNNHCISDEAIDGCTQVKGIGGTRGVAISPNGENVYVGSTSENSVAEFSREPSSGALAQLAEPDQCVSSGSSGGACTSDTLVGLMGARRLTVSPDGTNVYVASQGDNAVVELARSETPSVSEVVPNEGQESGGTEVTIKGSGFIEGAKVSFGGNEASGVVIKSGTELTAISPAGKREPVDITVKTSVGTSEVTPNDQYFYTPPNKLGGQVIEAYCKSIGDEGDGGPASALLKKEVSGPDFAYHNWACVKDNGDEVEIVETGPAPSMENLCEAQYPETSSFGYPSNPDNAFSWNCFVYQPKVTSVNPKAVNASGGGPIKIKGEHLKGTSAVSFGGSLGSISSVPETEITAEAPAHTPGSADVVVTTGGGESATGSADRIAFVAGPAIDKIEPTEGPEAGSTHVKIFGEFLESGSVSFGGSSAKILKESATELEVEAPPHAAGSVEVEFDGPAGEAAGGPANRFTYEATPTPTVTAVSPNEGPTGGATMVKISGTNFTSASEVKFGPNAATSVEFKNAGELIAKSPSGSGSVDVRVKTAGGTSATSSADEFFYRATPTVTGITPNEGPTGGATTVKISGTNFTRASEVKFGPNAATSVEFKNSGELLAKEPFGFGLGSRHRHHGGRHLDGRRRERIHLPGAADRHRHHAQGRTRRPAPRR